MTHQFPYYRDPSQLPGPLPSIEEIHACPVTFGTSRYLGRIVLVRDTFIVKYGVHVHENEGSSLLLLERQTSVPAPRLYAMFRRDGAIYLIMEYLPGTPLDKLWPTLSESDKDSITQQLRTIVDHMRSLQAPSQQFCSAMDGPLHHRFFWWNEQDTFITGPFATERDFNFSMAKRSELIRDGSSRLWLSEFFARHLPIALNGHIPTFTHADLHRGNILVVVTPPQNESTKPTFKISGIVDWETAGWYPSYWEYAAAFVLFQWVDDWPEKFERILDPWPLEAAMLRMVRQDLEC
jgi:hypothetical protein